MNTPITDDAWYHNADHISAVDASLARRLELDRIALMEALEQCLSSSFDGPLPNYAREAASTALATARANFPEP